MRLRVVGLVLAVAVVAAGCGYHTFSPPGPAPLRYRDEVFTAVTKTADVSYGSAVNQSGVTVDLKLDVYRPTGDTVTQRPAIVWIHGGGFSGGNRLSPEIVDQATVFAKKGYVTVSIAYRLVAGGCSAVTGGSGCLQAIIDAQHDAQAAVRFLRRYAATYGVDPNRIAIGGTSAGAITALNVGANSEDPGTSGNPGFSSAVKAVSSLSGAKLGGAPQSATDAHSLMFHGSSDFVVPYQWALNTQTDATAAGLVSYVTTYQGEGHVPYAHRNEIISQTTNFFYWCLDLRNAAT
jgi:para-nitrobenzyl esterase